MRGHAAALDRRLADPVLEAERRPPGRQLVAVLPPDQLDARQLLVGPACPLDDRLEPLGVGRERGQRDVHVRRAERLLPVLGAALADVAQLGRARRHALPELRREAVQRVLRHAERLEAVVGEGDGDPGVAGRVGRRSGRSRRRGAAAAPARGRRRGRRCAAAGRCRRRATAARAARRSGCRRARGWMPSAAVTASTCLPSSVVLGRLGRVRVGRRQVRERARWPAGVARSTPSRMTGPFPALTSSVKIVSITSSLSARPPQVSCARRRAGGQLDLEEASPARRTAW